MKLAVIGSRNFSDSHLLTKCLNMLNEEYQLTTIVSGGAKGADIMGQRWAEIRGIETEIYLPDWENLGKRAGILRNKDIVEASDIIIAFWDGISNGTRNSIDVAHSLRKPVIVYIGSILDNLLTKTTYKNL
jgi:hypothetical protein